MRRLTALAVVVLSWLVILPSVAFGQASGSITGVVKDASGAVLPGVTVQASSPALIEKTRSVVTDGTGQYRIISLFPGTYSVTFTLMGFNTVKRDGLEITGAFVATLNAELKVGAVTETITVTGETPIVDVQSTTRQRVISSEVIDAVPTSRTPYQLATLVPGVTAQNGAGTASVQDVGGSAGNQQSNTLVVHGSRPLDMRLTYNGITLGTLETGRNAGAVNNATALEEVTVDSSAVSAELATGGVRVNLIPREGGNTFKGSFFYGYTDERFQGDNYTQDLKDRGLTTPNGERKLWDFNPGFGGPLKKDKLWFYTTIRYNGWQDYIAGLFTNLNVGNPNVWTYAPDLNNRAYNLNRWYDGQIRLTWQANAKNRVAVSYNPQLGRPTSGGSATASGETVTNQWLDPKRNVYADWTAPITNRLLLEAVVTEQYERGASVPFVDPGSNPLIGVTEQSTGLTYRGITATYSNTPKEVYYYRAAAAYVTGAHAFKVGFNNGQGTRKRTEFTPQPTSYRFNNGVPNQITLRAVPYIANSSLDSDGGIYAQDKWTTGRLTVSVGVRYDFYSTSFPEQALGPGPLTPTRNFVIPAQEGVSGWRDITPKSGIAYDLFGNGKTAIKATLNKYLQGQALGTIDPVPFGSSMNPVSRLVLSTTRSWTDSNRNFIPDCNLTNPAAQTVVGGDVCGAMANSSFGQLGLGTTYDPDITGGWGRRSYNWEFSTSVQHEILPRLSVDVGYFRRVYGNLPVTDNLTVAPSDYSPFSIVVPADSRLPNGGGNTISGLYDLNPAKFGLPANNFLTYSDKYGNQIEHWNGFDVSASLRRLHGLQIQGGMSAGKTTTDNCDVVTKLDNPSTLYCHVETPFLSQIKALAIYTIPKIDLNVSGTYQSVPGPAVVANLNVPTAVVAPSLGRPLSGGAANVTVNVIPVGTLYGDRDNQVDLRFAKILRLAQTRIALNLDLYNLLNANPVVSENPNYAVFRQPTAILPARLLKFGVQLDF